MKVGWEETEEMSPYVHCNYHRHQLKDCERFILQSYSNVLYVVCFYFSLLYYC